VVVLRAAACVVCTVRMVPCRAPDDGRMYPKHVELRIHQ